MENYQSTTSSSWSGCTNDVNNFNYSHGSSFSSLIDNQSAYSMYSYQQNVFQPEYSTYDNVQQASLPQMEKYAPANTLEVSNSKSAMPAIKDVCASYKHVLGAAKTINELSSVADNVAVNTLSHTQPSKTEKPPYSYVALICLALNDSPTKKCTLREIVDYIADKFPYYKQNSKLQSSIRHNLTLNDCFMKSGRRLGDKGCLWTLDPAYEDMFKYGSLQRRKYRLKEGRVDRYRRNKSKKMKQVSDNKTSTPIRKQPEANIIRNISNEVDTSRLCNSADSGVSYDISSSPCCANLKDNSSDWFIQQFNESLTSFYSTYYSNDLDSISSLPVDQFDIPAISLDSFTPASPTNNSYSLTNENSISHEESMFSYNQSSYLDVPVTQENINHQLILGFDSGYFSS